MEQIQRNAYNTNGILTCVKTNEECFSDMYAGIEMYMSFFLRLFMYLFIYLLIYFFSVGWGRVLYFKVLSNGVVLYIFQD